MKNKIPYILDGGECKVGMESTIIGFEKEVVIIYRLGAISVEEIEKTLQQKVKLKLTSEEPASPGQLKSHYATKKPLYYGDVKKLLQKFKNKKAAVITLHKKYEVDPSLLFCLSESGDLHEAAANLFKVLRSIDKSGIDVIIADHFPDEGIGRAINDRLKKAQELFK